MFTKLFAVSAIAFMATAVQAQEVTTPPTFDIDPGEVGVIFAADQDTYFEVIKDSKGNSASNWAPVKWGQKCTVSEDEAGDGAAIRIDNLDFLQSSLLVLLISVSISIFTLIYGQTQMVNSTLQCRTGGLVRSSSLLSQT